MAELRGKTLFITGASRGIGKAIALRAARDGANVVVTGKTEETHPRLEGTIYSAAQEIEAAGGRALAAAMDVRHTEQIEEAVERAVKAFGGIDILVNNASAIALSDVRTTPMKRVDLMLQVNSRGTYAASMICFPHLAKAENPHILNLAPPPSLDPKWYAKHLAYSVAKYGMSLCVLGMAEEFREAGVAVNALWPRTTIATAAIRLLESQVKLEECRRPEIVADAAHAILKRDAARCTGNFFIDDEVLAEEGVSDLSAYAVKPGGTLQGDIFLDTPVPGVKPYLP